MLNKKELSSKIPGWGSDINLKNRPAVPKEKKSPQGTGAHWKQPEHQHPRFKIHKSPEHQTLTPVFGTSCPPRGISGRLRDFAYKYSEGRLSHWLILLLADRVDVIESIVIDTFKGKPDRPFKEMGLRSEFTSQGRRSKLQRKKMAFATAVVGVVPLIAGLAFSRKQASSRADQKARADRKTA